MCLRLTLGILFLVSVVAFLAVLIIGYPKLNELSDERNIFLDKQYELYDMWDSQPLRQKQKFYFYNITNGDEFFFSDVPMLVDEIGPFTYDEIRPDDFQWNKLSSMNFLDLESLKFIPSESVADESTFLYTLNIPLIRSLFLQESGSELGRYRNVLYKNLVHRTTVRDILREVIDGYSLRKNSTLEFVKVDEVLDIQRIVEELQSGTNISYMHFLRNELCLRLFSVFRFVNSPVYKNRSLSRIFEKVPCRCLTFMPNGTEEVHRSEPEPHSVQTSKYFLDWNNDVCAADSKVAFVAIGDYGYVTENLFSVSSRNYWNGQGYSLFNFNTKDETAFKPTYINVEPTTDVITEFTFRYQFNIPMKFGDDKDIESASEKFYPILLTEIFGKSEDEINSSIYHYIVFPRIFISKIAPRILFLVICISITATTAVFIWVLNTQRRTATNETTPLLRRSVSMTV